MYFVRSLDTGDRGLKESSDESEENMGKRGYVEQRRADEDEDESESDICWLAAERNGVEMKNRRPRPLCKASTQPASQPSNHPRVGSSSGLNK